MEGTTEHKWYEISREALLLGVLMAKSELQCTIFVLSNLKGLKKFIQSTMCACVTVITVTN